MVSLIACAVVVGFLELFLAKGFCGAFRSFSVSYGDFPRSGFEWRFVGTLDIICGRVQVCNKIGRGGAGGEVLIRKLRHVSRPRHPSCAVSVDLECTSLCTAP